MAHAWLCYSLQKDFALFLVVEYVKDSAVILNVFIVTCCVLAYCYATC